MEPLETLRTVGAVLWIVASGVLAMLVAFAVVTLIAVVAAGLDRLLGVDRPVSRGAGAASKPFLPPGYCGAADEDSPAARRQRELASLQATLTATEWLGVLQLLRHGVSSDGVINLLRLRRERRGAGLRQVPLRGDRGTPTDAHNSTPTDTHAHPHAHPSEPRPTW